MSRALTYVELDIPYCSLLYGVTPCMAGVGTLGGNMVSGGGLAAVRDGITSQAFGSCARLDNSAAAGTIIIDFGDGSREIVESVRVHGPSNDAIVRNSSNIAASVTMKLQGSDDGITWEDLASVTTTTASAANRLLTAASPQVWRYIQVLIPAVDSSSDRAVAEIVVTKQSIPAKCFNTKSTCQDGAHYSESTVTLRFAIATDYLPRDIDCIPCLDGEPDFSPGRVSLGENLGERSQLRVRLRDHKHSDAGQGFDKYRAERPYDPYEQGSLFGRFRARQPYLRGKALRWIQGFVGEALADMETRRFVVDSVDGPDQDGYFTIVAKDVLKLLDRDRAQAPVPSKGYLGANIDASVTTAQLLPIGIGDADYPASGTVNIGGDELCTFTRSGDTLTLVRGRFNTVAVAHDAEDLVQQVLRFNAVSPATIIRTLEVTYAGVPNGYISLSEWQTEIDSFLGQVYSAIIPHPTPVKQLIAELLEQAGLAHWWDDEQQKLRLQVIREVNADAEVFSKSKRLADSYLIKDQPEKRISRVLLFYGIKDSTKGLEEESNYRSRQLTIDTDAEADYGNAVLKKIYSRWIPQFGGAVAEKVNIILLSRYRNAPRSVSFDIVRGNDIVVPQLGQGYQVSADGLQDASGAAVNMSVQVTRLKPMSDVIHVEAEEMDFFNSISSNPDQHVVIIAGNTSNFNLRTAHDAVYGSPSSGDTVICIVAAGVTVKSTSANSPAFNVGGWPAGTTLSLINNGRIQGKGGNGGRGGDRFDNGGGANVIQPAVGLPGGTAFKTTKAIAISGTGKIYGGGGGGGGGAPSVTEFAQHSSGGGGGGGQGADPGTGATKRFDAGAGKDGTVDAAGVGGAGDNGGKRGGNGGAAGQPGQRGGDLSSLELGGAGGAAGAAIDGNSFVTETGTLDIIGSRIN